MDIVAFTPTRPDYQIGPRLCSENDKGPEYQGFMGRCERVLRLVDWQFAQQRFTDSRESIRENRFANNTYF